jgi:DNA topoisomerase-1
MVDLAFQEAFFAEIDAAEAVQLSRAEFGDLILLSTDAEGHEHKGKGEGGGQFTGKGEGGGSAEPAKPKEKRGKPGSQLPPDTGEKMKALGMVGSLPPADVPASKIKIADLSRGKEALKFEALMSWDQTTKSGRISRQYRYTQEFHDRNAAEKHERVAAIKPHIARVQELLEARMTDAAIPERAREAAAIANVIRETGLRPTDSDESVQHGHFGISSIQARHCTIAGNEIRLEFTGKEGVLNKAVIRDPANVAFIEAALKNSTGEEFVFRAANSNNAGDVLKDAYAESGGSGDIKIKDLRTLKAHQIAEQAVADYRGVPPPLTGDKKKDGKAIAKAILEMATKVSNVLNNKPEESRDTYVHPDIWRAWQQKLSIAA